MLIVRLLGAPRPSSRLRRRARRVDSGEPGAVPLSRVTVAGGRELSGRAAARDWLEEVAGDPENRSAEVRAATRLVNRALGALRAGARDPLVQEIGATKALTIRIGYGTGEELAGGRWTEARQLPPPRRGRLDDVDPQGRVAAVLAGRDQVHPAETLLLRARLDQQLGREAEARLGLEAARAALKRDPGPRDDELRKECTALEERLESA